MTVKSFLWNLAILSLCLLAAWVCGYTYMLGYAPSVPDFESYYLAAQAWEQGQNPYLWQNLTALKTNAATGEPFPYLYTPPTAQAVTALTCLPFADAARMWGTGLVLAYGLCLFLTGTLCFRLGLRFGWVPDTGFHRAVWVLFSVAVGLLFPYLVNLACGQVNIFVMLPLLAYLLWYADEKPFLSGMALGVASAIKMVPVFLLLAHMRSSRSFWVGFGTGVAAVVGVSVALFGVLPWVQFWEALPGFSYGTRVQGLWEISVPYNIGLSGKFARLFHDHARSIFIAGAACGFLVLAYYVYTAKRIKDFSPAFFLRMGAAAVLMVLFSPIAYVHHLVWLFPPVMVYVLFLWYGRVRHRWTGLLLLALALCLSLIDFTVTYYNLPFTAGQPYVSINTFGLLWLAGLMLFSAHRAVKE